MGREVREPEDGPGSTGETPAWEKEAQGPPFGLQGCSIWTSKKPLMAINALTFLHGALIISTYCIDSPVPGNGGENRHR